MGLRQKLDEEEQALLEIISDPIWLGEFLRSTADGETDMNVWPKELWGYRDYQRQFLSDTSEFIVYTGGRAIGKCQPASSRIYTTEGYKAISELYKREYFIVYALDERSQEIVQRRAVITHDKVAPCYTITTESGYTFTSTALHPILTPEGWRLMDDLKENDYVAVTTRLPHESNLAALQWHELRLLGYILLMPIFRAETKILPRYKRIGAELETISDALLTTWHKDFDGRYSFHHKAGPFKHPITSLLEQCRLYSMMRKWGAKRIPRIIKQERLDHIAIFIEGLFAQFATITAREISINVPHSIFANDLQELLLRFGIESRIIPEGEEYRVELLNYRAVYRFLKTFDLPGINVGQLQPPPASNDINDSMRYDRITSKYQSHVMTNTYAVHVYEHNNYIGDNLHVHNSVVLEDKIVYDIVNSQTQYPVTPEMVLVTANQAQMGPLADRIITRFTASSFLKDFLRNNVNKSAGTMTFPRKGKPFIFRMRIAGSNDQSNMVGLHIPKIIGDEAQLFPLPAYTQLDIRLAI